jgi:hypothetical protein
MGKYFDQCRIIDLGSGVIINRILGILIFDSLFLNGPVYLS